MYISTNYAVFTTIVYKTDIPFFINLQSTTKRSTASMSPKKRKRNENESHNLAKHHLFITRIHYHIAVYISIAITSTRNPLPSLDPVNRISDGNKRIRSRFPPLAAV